jgi:hypothetical protein
MKLLLTIAAILLPRPRIAKAFSPLQASHIASTSYHSTSLKMSETQQQPDVSPFMNGPRPDETKEYIMQQTMVRVKDPVKSLEFYCNVLGFRLIHYSEVSVPIQTLFAFYVGYVKYMRIPNFITHLHAYAVPTMEIQRLLCSSGGFLQSNKRREMESLHEDSWM